MTKDELLQRWHRTIHQCQVEYELSARKYEKRNRKLGVPVVIFSAIVGASILGTLQKSGLEWVQVMAGRLRAQELPGARASGRPMQNTLLEEDHECSQTTDPDRNR